MTEKTKCDKCYAINETPIQYIGRSVYCNKCATEYIAIGEFTDDQRKKSATSNMMVGASVLTIIAVVIIGIPILLVGGCKYLVHRSEVAEEQKELKRERLRAELEEKYPSRDSASSGSTSSGGSYSSSGSADVHGAWAYMQIAVEQRLKSPKSADFPFGGSRHVTPLGGDRYRVNSYVDATNSFGAEIRTNFTGVIKKVSGGWQVESLSLQ
jgi:hypothetical protein